MAEHMILAGFQTVNGKSTLGEVWLIFRAQFIYIIVSIKLDPRTESDKVKNELT